MTLDMNKLTAIRDEALGGGAPFPTAQEPVALPAPKPYEGRSFSQIMIQDVPRWNTAMNLSIAKGDLEGAKKYRDMIEETATDLQDDWLSFTQFKGDHPLGSMMRENSMRLLGGQFGDAPYSAALADEAVQKRATITSFGGPGILADHAWNARNPAADPAVAARSLAILGAAGAPPSATATQTVDMKDPRTGEVKRVRQPVGKLDPVTRDELAVNVETIENADRQLSYDPDFHKSLGGTGGVAKLAMSLSAAGDKDDPRRPLFSLAFSSVQDVKDPTERAVAFKSTVGMLERVATAANPNKDPARTGLLAPILAGIDDALGRDGKLPQKERAVIDATSRAFKVMDDASAFGVSVPKDKATRIAAVFAKKYTGRTLEAEDREIINKFERAEILKGGIEAKPNAFLPTVVATPGAVSGVDQQGKLTMDPSMGGISAAHLEHVNDIRGMMDAAASLSATLGEDYDKSLANVMETRYPDRIMAELGGSITGVKGDTIPVTGDMARGLARVIAGKISKSGTFDVTNFSREVMSDPGVAAAFSQEVGVDASKSAQSGKLQGAVKDTVASASATLTGPAKELADDFKTVPLDYWDMKPGVGAVNKMTEFVGKRIDMTPGLTDAVNPAKSTAYQYLASQLTSGTADSLLADKAKMAEAVRLMKAQMAGKLGTSLAPTLDRSETDAAIRKDIVDRLKAAEASGVKFSPDEAFNRKLIQETKVFETVGVKSGSTLTAPKRIESAPGQEVLRLIKQGATEIMFGGTPLESFQSSADAIRAFTLGLAKLQSGTAPAAQPAAVVQPATPAMPVVNLNLPAGVDASQIVAAAAYLDKSANRPVASRELDMHVRREFSDLGPLQTRAMEELRKRAPDPSNMKASDFNKTLTDVSDEFRAQYRKLALEAKKQELEALGGIRNQQYLERKAAEGDGAFASAGELQPQK